VDRLAGLDDHHEHLGDCAVLPVDHDVVAMGRKPVPLAVICIEYILHRISPLQKKNTLRAERAKSCSILFGLLTTAML
jgi:hypothetical protein